MTTDPIVKYLEACKPLHLLPNQVVGLDKLIELAKAQGRVMEAVAAEHGGRDHDEGCFICSAVSDYERARRELE